MNAIIALVRKDLVLFFSNRRAVIMSIAAPILIAAFFGSLFGSGGSKPANVPIAITDLDHSDFSKHIVAAMRGDTTLQVSELSEADALAQVKAGKLQAAVTLPVDFGKQAGRSMFGGTDKPVVQLHYDPSQSMALPLVRGLLAQHVMANVGDALLNNNSPVMSDLREQVKANTGMPADRRGDLMALFDNIAKVQGHVVQPVATAASGAVAGAATPGFSMPFTTKESEASSRPNVKYNSYSHSFAGMGVQFILMMGVDMAMALLLVRRQGLWKRLRAAPLSRAQLLSGSLLSCALIAVLVFTVIYAVAAAVFGVRIEGSAIGFVAVLLAFALLTASFGLMIAALGKTPEASRGLAILATLLMVMLGGAWVPAFIFPAWLQTLSLGVPTRWAIDGLDAMTWRGLPLEAALAPVGVMLAFTALFAAVAVARFQWEE